MSSSYPDSRTPPHGNRLPLERLALSPAPALPAEGQPNGAECRTERLSPGLLTVEEVSEVLRKRPAAVRAIANRGAISFYRVGRAMLFTPADIQVYLDRCRRLARGEKALAGLNSRRSR